MPTSAPVSGDLFVSHRVLRPAQLSPTSQFDFHARNVLNGPFLFAVSSVSSPTSFAVTGETPSNCFKSEHCSTLEEEIFS